jgi:hypothetical protein
MIHSTSRPMRRSAIEAIKAVVETKLGNHDNAVAKGCRMITWRIEPRREFTVKKGGNDTALASRETWAETTTL